MIAHRRRHGIRSGGRGAVVVGMAEEEVGSNRRSTRAAAVVVAEAVAGGARSEADAVEVIGSGA